MSDEVYWDCIEYELGADMKGETILSGSCAYGLIMQVTPCKFILRHKAYDPLGILFALKGS